MNAPIERDGARWCVESAPKLDPDAGVVVPGEASGAAQGAQIEHEIALIQLNRYSTAVQNLQLDGSVAISIGTDQFVECATEAEIREAIYRGGK
jgi:hypothetical protein